VQATLGVLSALGKGWRTPSGGQIDRYFQNDAAMYPGFSGGPLVAAPGQMLGINTSALLRGISAEVPVATVSRVVETLLEHGRVRRGFLGVGLQMVPAARRGCGRVGPGDGPAAGIRGKRQPRGDGRPAAEVKPAVILSPGGRRI